MKNPYLEMERKFLVRRLPRNLRRYPHYAIAQGYLVAERRAHVRLRKKGRIRTLTFKRGPARAREEREIRLNPTQFAILWPATKGARLTKTRYHIPWHKLTIELDLYHGSHEGLIVAEVEFSDAGAYHSFRPPDWFGDEVTGTRRYSNVKLARD
jgi:CYTH domain-containing protein